MHVSQHLARASSKEGLLISIKDTVDWDKIETIVFQWDEKCYELSSKLEQLLNKGKQIRSNSYLRNAYYEFNKLSPGNSLKCVFHIRRGDNVVFRISDTKSHYIHGNSVIVNPNNTERTIEGDPNRTMVDVAQYAEFLDLLSKKYGK